jgi:hypothetical protein
MRSKFLFLSALILMTCTCASGWAQRRLAIVEANGAMARTTPGFALAESLLTNDLSAKMTGKPGFELVDRAGINTILKEQNFQNSDRSSADTAVRIGKLLGVSQIVLVNVDNCSYTTHTETSGNKTQTIGTIVLRANVRMLDVESGVVLAQPTSSFQESVQVSETSKSSPIIFGPYHTPGGTKSTGGDPKVIGDNEFAKARDSVAAELSAKLTTTMASAPTAKMPSPLVAGISNGSVYINQGSIAGIKAGDRFQVIREVSTGLNDPQTGKPIGHRQRVCALTIVDVEETNASGTCQGGLPQSKDVAEPVHP